MFSKNLVIGFARASTAHTGMLPKTSDVVSEHHFFLRASLLKSMMLSDVGKVKLGLSGFSRLPASHSAVLFRALRDGEEPREQSFAEISILSLENEVTESRSSGEKMSLLSSSREVLISEAGKDANDSSFEIKSNDDVNSNKNLSQPLIIRQ